MEGGGAIVGIEENAFKDSFDHVLPFPLNPPLPGIGAENTVVVLGSGKWSLRITSDDEAVYGEVG